MKQCMHCGRNYDGHDGDMIDCPYCGEYGGNSWVYGGNGQKHAFSWDTPSGNAPGGALDGCGAAIMGILFLFLIPGRMLSYLWVLVRFAGIVFGCWILIVGLILLWDKIDSSRNRGRSGKDSGSETSPAEASSARMPSPSSSILPAGMERTTPPSSLRTEHFNTITVTDRNYYKS